MPYINQDDKYKFDYSIADLSDKVECAGDINYVVTMIVHNFINKKGLKYDTLNSAIGALECCKLELNRRIVGPYEDVKISQNGDACLIDLPPKN